MSNKTAPAESPTPKEALEQIEDMYDMLDELTASVEAVNIARRAEARKVVEPFAIQARYATDILLTFARQILIEGRAPTDDSKDVMEKAIRSVFEAIEEFCAAMETVKPFDPFQMLEEIDPTSLKVLSCIGLEVPESEER